jgi:hypothetical protein
MELCLTEEPSRNEHAYVLGRGLQSDSKSDETRAEEDGFLSADGIGQIWCVRQTANTSDRLDGI